ncbi:hypothetical protein [Pedobacter miscanthi]|uniref:hypothetical protein n=1 Tax=Pedobacter miscanthi TaxID=2259170 RepID=UPI00292E842F|nr:hypothetical protein [Pedobacter miscanthi]
MKIWPLLLLLIAQAASAQRIIIDRGHLKAVLENNAARLSAEQGYQHGLGETGSALKDIQLNLSAVILTEQLIYNSLAQVDQGLKSALAVRQIGSLTLEILSAGRQVVSQAASSPQLLPFAEQTCRQLAGRGIRLADEVSALVLKEGENVLMDFGKRDALLKKISLELKTIRALLYSMQKCMYWAARRGLLRLVNPFSGFVNTDKRMVENLLLNYKTIRKK